MLPVSVSSILLDICSIKFPSITAVLHASLIPFFCNRFNAYFEPFHIIQFHGGSIWKAAGDGMRRKRASVAPVHYVLKVK